jgi:pimeloyl-ACP methyl ester carboxylesterase
MATFVLVHGAWGGAWGWRKVVPLLRAAGHDVYATTATGLGERAHLADPAIDLDLYVVDVVNVLEYEDLRDVTLVGHSYGGMVITGVAEQVPERLAQLVYLEALAPADGESGFDAELIPVEDRKAAATAAEAAGMPGYLLFEPYADWIRTMLRDPADADWFLGRLVPQPIASYAQPIRLGNPATAALPRAFVFCTEGKGDAATDPWVRTAQRVRSDPGWRFRELATNHLAPVNDPRGTAEALLSFV